MSTVPCVIRALSDTHCLTLLSHDIIPFTVAIAPAPTSDDHDGLSGARLRCFSLDRDHVLSGVQGFIRQRLVSTEHLVIYPEGAARGSTTPFVVSSEAEGDGKLAR